MIICVDYDHTLADTQKGAHKPGAKMPAPMPGGLEAVNRIAQMGHRIVIFTARAQTDGGRRSVEDWLRYFQVPFERVTAIKDQTMGMFIDDRAFHFKSWGDVLRNLPYWVAEESRY